MANKFFSGLLGKKTDNSPDKTVINQINTVRNEAAFASPDSLLFISLIALDDYEFLHLQLVSTTKFKKVYNGADIVFLTENNSIELESDTSEIDNWYSPSQKKCIVEFDIELEPTLKSAIEQKTINGIEIKIGKKNTSLPIASREQLAKVLVID